MSSVTFPVDLGGDGSTVTDDANASTGLANGGHRTRFVPALSQTVAMANTAKTQAQTATTKATEAANSATAAATSAANAEASRDAIDNRIYPTPSATDPTTRPDGTAMQVGDLYFNSTANVTKRYSGSAWVVSDLAEITGASIVTPLSTDTVVGVKNGVLNRFSIQNLVNAGVASVTPVGGVLAVTGALSATGAFAVGPLAATPYSVRVSKSITGGATSFGVGSEGVIQSDVTTRAVYFQSVAATAASAFTLPTLQHFLAYQGTLGAGSSVTNQFGFMAESTLTGATNNFGFYGNIAAATGRWNFYANGTAANYFAGNVLIGHTDTLQPAGFGVAKTTVASADTHTSIATFSATGTGFGPSQDFLRSRGALGAHAIVVDGDWLGQINFTGSDGAAFQFGARIAAHVDGTPALNSVPGRLVFHTTPVGGSATVERMRISNDGTISLGSSPGSESLRVSRVASAVNYLQVIGAATGSGVGITAQGTDNNVDIALTAKGAGNFNISNSTSAATLGVELGTGTTVDKAVFIDFHSSSGTDYDYRLLRAAGANGNVDYVNVGTGAHRFFVNGAEQFRVGHTPSAVNYMQVIGGATGGGPVLSALGSDTNISLLFLSKGIVGHDFSTGVWNNYQFKVMHTASAVNCLSVTGSSAGQTNGNTIQPVGTDVDQWLNLSAKGGGAIRFWTAAMGAEQFRITHTASAVNYLSVTGGATGVAPYLTLMGTDTNIGLVLRLKGTAIDATQFKVQNGAGTDLFRVDQYTGTVVGNLLVRSAVTGGGVLVTTEGSATDCNLTFMAKGAGLVTFDEDSIRITTSKTPATAAATGTQGQIAWDASYVYVCTATNTWKRAALTTW